MLEGLSPSKIEWPCRVRTLLAELDEKDAAILSAAILDWELWAASTLSKELKKRGIVLSDNAITRHRKGYCSCLKI